LISEIVGEKRREGFTNPRFTVLKCASLTQPSPMPRLVIPASQLYAILDREYKKRRLMHCQRCRVPLPFFRAPPDSVSANWAFGTPSECPDNCQVMIAEILVELWAKFDLLTADTA
jgi:hypothetical protein